jgi:peptide/nickel transport system substrate-binding protein
MHRGLLRRSVSAVIFAALLSCSLGSCAPQQVKEAEEEVPSIAAPTETVVESPVSITVVQGSEPRSLDPSVCIGKSCVIVQNAMLDSLVYHTPENETIPWLATSWESVDPLTWRISLREGVKFHNGEEFDAEAVAFTIDAYNTSEGEGASFYQYVDHTEIVDEHTIDIVTKEPYAVTPESLSLMFVLPPEYYAEEGPEGFAQHPIGTGPFVFEEWQMGTQIVVRANPDYWNGRPEIDEVVFKNAPEGSTRVAMLLTGEADIVTDPPVEMLTQIEESPDAQVQWVPSLRKIFVEFYRAEPPFDDRQVRLAANYAVDKETLIQRILGGYGEVSSGVFVKGFLGHNPDVLNSYDYDPDKARELLAEAGYSDGVTVDFWYPIGRYMKDREVAEAIAGMLDQVGIHCEMHGMDISSLVEKVHTQTLSGMHFFSALPLFLDPDMIFRVQLSSEGLNQYAWTEKTDELGKAGVTAVDPEERAEVYQEMEEYLVNEVVPWIFLYDQALLYGVRDGVNWEPRPDEIIDLRNASVTQ